MKAFTLVLLLSLSAWSEIKITITENGPLISDSERVMVLECLKTKYNASFQWDVLRFPTNKILKGDKILTLRALNNSKSLPAPKGNTSVLMVKEDMYAPEISPVFAFFIPAAHLGLISTFHLTPDTNIPDWKKLRAQRIYKLLARLFPMGTDAKLSGQCIMKFSNRVTDLDAKSLAYCPEDERALRNVYLLKPEKSTALCELDTFKAAEIPIPNTTTPTTIEYPENMPINIISPKDESLKELPPPVAPGEAGSPPNQPPILAPPGPPAAAPQGDTMMVAPTTPLDAPKPMK